MVKSDERMVLVSSEPHSAFPRQTVDLFLAFPEPTQAAATARGVLLWVRQSVE